MGDAPAEKKRKAATAALRVRSDAHVDVADLECGSATKTTALVVDEDVARSLLQRHPYLEATEG